MLVPRSFLVAVAMSLLAAPAFADPPSRSDAVAQLSGFEHGPDLAAVRLWSDEGVALLVAIADDPAEALFVRSRALWSLRAFPRVPTARSFLHAVATRPSQNVFLLRAALDSLVAMGDLSVPQRSLDDASPEVREAAVWAFAHGPDAELGQRTLRRRLGRERSPEVLVAIRQGLGAPRTNH